MNNKLLNSNYKPPFYACLCITNCVPCLPLYGIQGGIYVRRINDFLGW